MPLLVIPLGADESDNLTLHEWDALSASRKVLFERADHPLLERLRAAGVDAGPLTSDPPVDAEGVALVTEPSSDRIVELARAGATITAGAVAAPDPLTAARAAPVGRRAATALGGLAATMARLRSPEGCPWDREQTHESLRVHLIEEAHEVLEAIDNGTLGEELEEELGDLLLQVVFHAQLARDDGRFDIADVAERITAKLLHRHPHVFGEVQVGGAHEVVANWEAIKAAEKGERGRFEGIPSGLSALLAAYKVQKRAAGAGFAATDDEARARLLRALEGEAGPEEVGEALFWLVALARSRGVDPEGALRSATSRFTSRFRAAYEDPAG